VKRGTWTTRFVTIAESIILAIFFGFVPVLFFLVATVIAASILFGTKGLGPWVLWSFVPAILIDAVFIRRWVRRAYQMSPKVLGLLYLFYSVIVLGMCMGVPILNFALCIAAGLYSARRMHVAEADEQTRKRYFKKTAAFCAAVMALMCCLITLWAIAGRMIGYRLETPWVSFTLTGPTFSAVVLTGTAVLTLLHFWLARTAARVTFGLLH
jgi:roadblock/LC7 domain-containing protein